MAAPRVSTRQGLNISWLASKYEKFEMRRSNVPYQQSANQPHKGRWWSYHPTMGYLYPRQVRGRGMEFRKFMGETQYITPHFMGGPLEAVHDEHRNKVFHKDITFPSQPDQVRHLDSHIMTQPYANYRINLHSKEALKELAKNAFDSSQRELIWNPHFPGRPVQGPAAISSNELEVIRKQAFLAGIEFPEFPDLKPAEQLDPWEDEGEYKVPQVSNDELLDKMMWDEINRNMRGMEAKVRAFKDSERKKVYTYKMAEASQGIKRARVHEAFLQKQTQRLSAKQKADQAEKERRIRMLPWMKKKMQEKMKEDDELREEAEEEMVPQEVIKERRKIQHSSLTFRPRGMKP